MLIVRRILVSVCIVSFVISVGNAQELGVEDSHLAVVTTDSGVLLHCYSKAPSGGISERNPFYYTAHPEITITKHFYNAKTGDLKFDVTFKELSKELASKMKLGVATSLNDRANADDVSLLPLEIEAYEVYLTLGDRRVRIATHKPSTASIGVKAPVFAKIEDSTMLNFLSSAPEELTASFVSYYRFKVFNNEVASGRISSQAVINAFEDVTGDAAKADALVTREVANTLMTKVRSNVEISLPVDASAALLALFDQFISKIDEFEPLKPSEIKANDEKLYYSVAAAKLDLTPDVLKELTNEWTNETKFRESFMQTWDELHDLAKSSINEEEFYKHLQGHVKGNQKSAAKFNMIEMFSAGGSSSFSLDTAWNNLTKEKQKKVKEFHDLTKTKGSIEESLLQDIAESWTGERTLSSVTPNNLKIYRVTKQQLLKVFRTTITLKDVLGTELKPTIQNLDLVGPSTKISVGELNKRLSAVESGVSSLVSRATNLEGKFSVLDMEALQKIYFDKGWGLTVKANLRTKPGRLEAHESKGILELRAVDGFSASNRNSSNFKRGLISYEWDGDPKKIRVRMGTDNDK